MPRLFETPTKRKRSNMGTYASADADADEHGDGSDNEDGHGGFINGHRGMSNHGSQLMMMADVEETGERTIRKRPRPSAWSVLDQDDAGQDHSIGSTVQGGNGRFVDGIARNAAETSCDGEGIRRNRLRERREQGRHRDDWNDGFNDYDDDLIDNRSTLLSNHSRNGHSLFSQQPPPETPPRSASSSSSLSARSKLRKTNLFPPLVQTPPTHSRSIDRSSRSASLFKIVEETKAARSSLHDIADSAATLDSMDRSKARVAANADTYEPTQVASQIGQSVRSLFGFISNVKLNVDSEGTKRHQTAQHAHASHSSSSQHQRQQQQQHQQQHQQRQPQQPQSQSKPLQGVVACLTGFSAEEKELHHALIEKLGGRFTRDLSAEENTHLIAPQRNYIANAKSFASSPSGQATNANHELLGPKLKLAFSTSRMHVVVPDWLQACDRCHERVDEVMYAVWTLPDERSVPWRSAQKLNQQLTDGCRFLSTAQRNIASDTVGGRFIKARRFLFVDCQFVLLGFGDNSGTDLADPTNTDTNDSSLRNGGDDQLASVNCDAMPPTSVTMNIKNKASRLIRSGMGTIFWNHEYPDITHVIVNDTASADDRKLAQDVCKRHRSQLAVVSARWVLDCWKYNRLLHSKHYPPVKIRLPSRYVAATKTSTTAVRASKLHQSQITKRTSSIFRGCMFCIIRVGPSKSTATGAIPGKAPAMATTKSKERSRSTGGRSASAGGMDSASRKATDNSPMDPESGFLDWNPGDIEKMVKQNGGRMMSVTILNALKSDASKHNKEVALAQQTSQQTAIDALTKKPKRPLYVVFWGSNGLPSSQKRQYETIHPQLAPMMKNALVKVIWTTPLWLQTCTTLQKRMSPDRMPMLWKPQAWAQRPLEWRKSVVARRSSSGKDPRPTKLILPRFCVALSGFSETERAALLVLMQDGWNIEVTNDMTPRNTHLVCKEEGSAKYKKAVEWKLRIVSIDWLYHVVQFGYCGEASNSDGCESDFKM